MGKNTKIEWTATPLPDGTLMPGHTFNPWLGCAKVSAGCKYCYAETLMDTRYGRVEWGPNGTRVRTSDNYWKQPLMWDKEAEASGVRAKVFCGSLCDVYEDRHDLEEWRFDLFHLIKQTPHLDWLLLTKRPGNVAWFSEFLWFYPLPENVWLGVSVEDQETADRRIPKLVGIDAHMRFLSIEPMLGPINLGLAGTAPKDWGRGYVAVHELIHWVIIGGESGPKARPFDMAWAADIIGECSWANVPVFVKQVGDNPTWEGKPFTPAYGKERLVAKGHEPDQWPVLLRRREFPR